MGDISFVLAGVSSKDEYALRAIFDLAQQRPGIPIRIAKIGERQKIPQKFLELILSELKRGGFVESQRGADGGYRLSRSPDTITIGEVLRYVKGISDNRHSNKKPESENPFVALWSQVDAKISGIIDQTTFGELARKWQEQQSRNLPNWDI
jgi:Rrf2 family transcriptional regulator, cysteine metabolism repressor